MRFAAEALPISVPTVAMVRGVTVARVVVARVASTRRWIECILAVWVRVEREEALREARKRRDRGNRASEGQRARRNAEWCSLDRKITTQTQPIQRWALVLSY